MKPKFYYLLAAMLAAGTHASAQMHIFGNFQIAAGATVATPADVYGNANVLGNGLLLLNGTALQTLDFNGNTVPNLELDNSSNLQLSSGVRIGTLLALSAGKIRLGANDLVFAPSAAHTGASAAAYIVTDNTGVVTMEGLNTGASFSFPVGRTDAANDYTPADVTNQAASRDISVQVKDYASSPSTEGNVTKGIDRTWQIHAGTAGNALIALTHNAATEGSQFNRNAAFVTGQQSSGFWSVGTPGSGTNGGFTHSSALNIPLASSPSSYFSKSSDAAISLPVPSVDGKPVIGVFPNPFSGEAWLTVTDHEAKDINYRLLETTGRIVAAGSIVLKNGTATCSLPVRGLAAGTYYLVLDRYRLDTPVKIIKQ